MISGRPANTPPLVVADLRGSFDYDLFFSDRFELTKLETFSLLFQDTGGHVGGSPYTWCRRQCAKDVLFAVNEQDVRL